MEDWLPRAMADLAACGSIEATPIDLTQSLAAMAALLRDAIQSKPASTVASSVARAVSAPAAAEAKKDNSPYSPGDRDCALGKRGPMGMGDGSAPVAASVDAGCPETAAEVEGLVYLSRRLDQLERQMRKGADIDGDQSLREALTHVEVRLRQLTAGDARTPKSGLRAGHEIAKTLSETQSPPPGEPTSQRHLPENAPDLIARPRSGVAEEAPTKANFHWQKNQGAPAVEEAERNETDGRVETMSARPRPPISSNALAAVAPATEATQQASNTALAFGKVESELRPLTRKAENAIAQGGDSRPYEALAVQTPADKIVAAPEPAAGQLSINALKREIKLIADRLDEVDKGFPSVANLERSINRMLEQVSEIRRAVASRNDAPRQNACADCDDCELRVARAIAELRTARDEADKRVHLALNAVQETVGKVSERLAKIEADLGDIRPARNSLLPVSAPCAQRRRRGDEQYGALQEADTHRDAPGAEASDPILVKTRESATPSLPGRDAFQLSNADADDADKSAEPADLLIEPGAGFPRRREPAEPGGPAAPPQRKRETGAGRAEFIAAARRAAQAAQLDAKGAPATAKARANAAGGGETGGFYDAHWRPIILGLAAFLLALGAFALAKAGGLERIDPPGFLKSTGRGGSLRMPSAEKSKGAEATQPKAAAYDGPQHPDAALFYQEPDFLDPARVARTRATREAAASQRNAHSGADAPMMRAIAGSDPIVVGGIGVPGKAMVGAAEPQKPAAAANARLTEKGLGVSRDLARAHEASPPRFSSAGK